MTESKLVGTHPSAVVTVTDNPPGHYPDPPLEDFMLGLGTKGTGHARVDLGAGTLRDDLCVANSIHFTAANTATDYEVNFMFSLTIISMPMALMAEAAGRSPDALDFEDLHKCYLRDPNLTLWMTQMSDEARAGNPNGPLFTDHLQYAIADRLAMLARQANVHFVRQTKLSARQLDLVIQKMEDDLEERVTLADLAQLVDLSVFQFSRAFHATLGETPYRYLMLRRISRAEAYLRAGQMSLAEISYACGFSSQAHMTTVFAKYSGYSPGSLRRAMGG